MLTEAQKADLQTLRQFPQVLETAVHLLTEEQLNTFYVEGEWNVRQIVHHMADSHMNSFIRLKLILTEQNPSLKPYAEPLWAETADVTAVPITASITLLKGLHPRWVALFESLTEEQWERTGFHSELNTSLTPRDLLASYAKHCRDHMAQLTRLLKVIDSTG